MLGQTAAAALAAVRDAHGALVGLVTAVMMMVMMPHSPPSSHLAPLPAALQTLHSVLAILAGNLKVGGEFVQRATFFVSCTELVSAGGGEPAEYVVHAALDSVER